MTINIYSSVQFPQLRQVLIFCLQDLSDKKKQINEWINPLYPHAFWDHMRNSIDAIFDDFELDKNPEDQIGYILVNQNEIKVIEHVIKCFENVFQNIGDKQPDSAYINSPLWDEVIHAAKNAFNILMKNEEKASLTNPHYWTGEENNNNASV